MKYAVQTRVLALTCLSSLWGHSAATAAPDLASCELDHAPVVTLDYGSRYSDGDASRSTLNAAGNAAVNKALKPVDQFIRRLSTLSDKVQSDADNPQEIADCMVAAIAVWAKADALSDLATTGANLTVGARIAALGLVYENVRDRSARDDDKAVIENWLVARSAQQIEFWEKDATQGARSGNLRAWSALAVLATGQLTQNDSFRLWAAASYGRILCTAREDGSLPQETKRGKYALHYQFHAIAPLSIIAARLERDGMSVKSMCNNGLSRAVGFALTDLANEGKASEGYSKKRQSYFDGSSSFRDHMVAFLPAYLTLFPEDVLATQMANTVPEFSNTKLGGRQELLWNY